MANLVSSSSVSAMTQTPASAPLALATLPAMTPSAMVAWRAPAVTLQVAIPATSRPPSASDTGLRISMRILSTSLP